MGAGRGSTTTAGMLLGLLLLGGGCESCELLTGPEHQVRKVILALGRDGYQGEGLKAELDLVISAVRLKGDRAEVFARVDVEGRYRGSEVSCICIERIALRRGAEGWALEGFPLRRLAGVTDALEARREAFEAQDLEAYTELVAPDYDGGRAALVARLEKIFTGGGEVRQSIERRVMRVEARGAQVTESYRFGFRGEGEQALDEREGKAAYRLVPTPGGWRFESGLL